MILFFDRNIGTAIPKSLKQYLKPKGVTIEFHQEHFDMKSPDDVWLSIVGGWGWIVVGHDYNFHLREPELAAIKEHDVGVFYLWGSESSKWESMRSFARAFDNIVEAADKTTPPYIYKVEYRGNLTQVSLSSF